MMRQPEVFISYAWQGESEQVAREVETCLTGKGLHVIRDQGHLGYKGRITDILRDINALTPQRHKESGYEELYRAIVERYEQDRRESTIDDKKPETPQIKILPITASPNDVEDIYYEREQDTLLEAFKDFDREQVFLDMPDPVKSTLVEIKERLAGQPAISSWAPDTWNGDLSAGARCCAISSNASKIDRAP